MKFMLRLSGAHGAGYAIVSIPRQYVLSTRKTGICGPLEQDRSDGYVWGHAKDHSRIATAALEYFDKQLEEVIKKDNKRIKKKAAEDGVKIMPSGERDK